MILRLLIIVIMCFSQVILGLRIFNVNNYGAIGDGRTDCTQAFMSSWKEACNWKDKAVIQIPKGIYLLRSLLFQGPCKGPISFNNEGILKAYNNIGLDYWIEFKTIDRLDIVGGGLFDGQGSRSRLEMEHDHNEILPISLMLYSVNYARIDNVKFINSKDSHIKIYACNNLTLSHISISAPKDSLNTDGINIALSKHIQVLDSKISTGDDCISLLSGSEYVNITGIQCGPGHGISIGSMGSRPNEPVVNSIMVKHCNLSNTLNGVRIKTWATNNFGKIENVVFEDIIVSGSWNPIIIDQNYCPSHRCPMGDSHIQINNVKFVDIKGVSKSDVAVNFQCSNYFPCFVEMKNINLKHSSRKRATLSKCHNVRGIASGYQKPPPCIKKQILKL